MVQLYNIRKFEFKQTHTHSKRNKIIIISVHTYTDHNEIKNMLKYNIFYCYLIIY